MCVCKKSSDRDQARLRRPIRLKMAAEKRASYVKRRAEKNCAEDLEERHSGVSQLPLRVHATQNAGSGGCPRGSHQILNDF